MNTIVKHIPHTVDLNEPVKKTYIDTLLATEDNLAHCFDITLKQGVPSGAAVTAYFIRYCDNATLPAISGTVSGNVISATLNKACYNKAGQFAIIIKVVADGVTNTVFYGEGTIFTSMTDTILDEENVVPSLSDLLEQIAAMEEATDRANSATNRANTAAARAELLAIDASGYAGDSAKLGGVAASNYMLKSHSDHVTPQDYGAKADGVTDDTDAINEAIIAANGRPVFLPEGVYLVSAGNELLDGAVILRNGTCLYGAGVDKTVIKSANGNSHVLSAVSNIANVAISDLTIDANAQDYAMGTHGIRFQGIENLNIKNCKIINPQHYGISFALGGAAKNVSITDCYIGFCGGDCIDFKNSQSGNENIIIADCNFESPNLNNANNYQVCIDIRARSCSISNINITNLPNSASGIRMRDSNDAQGEGGVYNSISNVNIIGENQSGTGTGIICYTGTTINGATIRGVSVGVQLADKCRASGVVISDCTDGFRTIGDDFAIINCDVHNCTGNGIRLSNNYAQVIGCSVDGCNRGLFANTAVENAVIIGNVFKNNTTPMMGTIDGIRKNNSGLRTYSGFEELDVSTVGVKNITFSHNIGTSSIPPNNCKIAVVCADKTVQLGTPCINIMKSNELGVSIPVVTAGTGEVTATVYLEIDG